MPFPDSPGRATGQSKDAESLKFPTHPPKPDTFSLPALKTSFEDCEEFSSEGITGYLSASALISFPPS